MGSGVPLPVVLGVGAGVTAVPLSSSCGEALPDGVAPPEVEWESVPEEVGSLSPDFEDIPT